MQGRDCPIQNRKSKIENWYNPKHQADDQPSSSFMGKSGGLQGLHVCPERESYPYQTWRMGDVNSAAVDDNVDASISLSRFGISLGKLH
jgi:hypothetical protein